MALHVEDAGECQYDAGRTYRTFTLASGALVATPPAPAGNVALVLASGGVVRVLATYVEQGAAGLAHAWRTMSCPAC